MKGPLNNSFLLFTLSSLFLFFACTHDPKTPITQVPYIQEDNETTLEGMDQTAYPYEAPPTDLSKISNASDNLKNASMAYEANDMDRCAQYLGLVFGIQQSG